MHTEIRPTDAQWLAQGWWRHYHKHRRPRRVAALNTAAMILLVVGVAIFFGGFVAGFSVDDPFSHPYILAITGTGLALGATGIILCFHADTRDHSEEDRFLDYVLDQWEQGDTSLPDNEMVAEYLKQQELRR